MSDRPDPTWNHPLRTVLVYALPLGLLTLCLERGWVGVSRDFWVPFLFGLFFPAYNSRLRAGRSWAFTNFQHQDGYPPTIALLHAGFWCVSINSLSLILQPPWSWIGAALVSTTCFWIYDYLLLRNDLLRIYVARYREDGSPDLGVTMGLLTVHWTAFHAFLVLNHLWGRDHVLWIGVAAVIQLTGAQLSLARVRSRLQGPEDLSHVREVAVVGGGWSGIYATKWLQEAGLRPVCFEAADRLGGVWNLRAGASVCDTTRATSSKAFLHASDFPMDVSASAFPGHAEIREFLDRYVDHFELRRCFELETRVVRIEKRDGRWQVTTRTKDHDEQRRSFDAVVICSGPQERPRSDVTERPPYRDFSGEILHATQLKRAADVRPGESVLIVGGGESASDLASLAVQRAGAVYWSIRGGQWFADRVVWGSYPVDEGLGVGLRVFLGRFLNVEAFVRYRLITDFINLMWGWGGHGIEPWLPDVPYLCQFLNKSRDGIYEVYKERIVPCSGIDRIRGREVSFAGRDEPVHVDRIILATGYRPELSFLEGGLERVARARYKKVFFNEDPTLALVGFVRPPLGSIPSLAELQARWIAGVYSGAVKLPGPVQRLNALRIDARNHSRLFEDESDLQVLADQELYATGIAEHLGAEVSWIRLLGTNPRGFLRLLRAPWLPFKYHLSSRDPDRRRRAWENIVRETHRNTAVRVLMGIMLMDYVLLPAAALGLGLAFFPATSLPGIGAGACLILAAKQAIFGVGARYRRRRP